MKLHRRHFLALSVASAGGILLSRWAVGQNQTPHSVTLSPDVYKSTGGLLELSLEAGSQNFIIGDRQVSLLSYNGQVPAPRLEAKPGDTVRIHFTNKLSQPTNLHYHGLHVTPADNADNVFLSISPNEQLTYEFQIPQNHPAGTFWYHPHRHGTVAEQVFGGLAGLFIVRGDLDEIPEVKAAQEEFLVLQDFDPNASGQPNAPDPMTLMRGREGALITVNRQVNPTLSIASGGLLRLRLLNASPSRFYRLALENHPLYLIATDGGAIANPIELEELLLAPGERAEVLVRGDRPVRQYRLLNLPYDRGGMGGMTMPNMASMSGMNGMSGMMNPSQSQPPQTSLPLATLTYQGSTASLKLPEKLIEVESLPEPSKTRRIELSMAMGNKMSFLFNGKTFDPERVDADPKLGTVEDWELVNVDPDRMDHPFHLHVNPFQVISRNGQPEPDRAWKDTVLVKGGETVRIRIPFRDFAGKTVYHCHILDHEDLGMMGRLDIQS
ncbi:multicopper oxidase family protein [Microcoleus sp. FACHB-1515]|uniref:multicopper oxidase family protein n=1 Tax=Cyanophyceae TaxID=3028117 RepID=UPI0016852557|nr:multicopper oxidase family protein [Microcoleus sp. FACHB-1515]MBD2093286.1 multicopper oxidase family protein [Microcoleus sp. FACHB-1515]